MTTLPMSRYGRHQGIVLSILSIRPLSAPRARHREPHAEPRWPLILAIFVYLPSVATDHNEIRVQFFGQAKDLSSGAALADKTF